MRKYDMRSAFLLAFRCVDEGGAINSTYFDQVSVRRRANGEHACAAAAAALRSVLCDACMSKPLMTIMCAHVNHAPHGRRGGIHTVKHTANHSIIIILCTAGGAEVLRVENAIR